jgi:uncharacterized protein (DUF2225 family)
MPSESPFLILKIECPICKTINECEMIKVGAYTEGGRDTDFCPTEINWRFSRYQAYNPLVYFTTMCGNCYYTREMTNEYKDWKNDNTFRTYRLKAIKDKHLEHLSTADSVVKQMGAKVDTTRYPNESAILKLLLAIYDEQLFEHHSCLDLGRFYLRVGWVFRQSSKGENPHAVMLRGLIQELERGLDRLSKQVGLTRPELSDFLGTVNSQFAMEALPAEIASRILPFREKFSSSLNGIGTAIAGVEQQISELTRLVDEYKSNVMGGESTAGESPFWSYPSFADFLLGLQRLWLGVATNEREALIKAVEYYRAAFSTGRDIAPGNQQIQASYLIAELSRRVGDYEQAKQYFSSTIKSGQEFIYQNRQDQSRTALARKILELAMEQGRSTLAAAKSA